MNADMLFWRERKRQSKYLGKNDKRIVWSKSQSNCNQLRIWSLKVRDVIHWHGNERFENNNLKKNRVWEILIQFSYRYD